MTTQVLERATNWEVSTSQITSQRRFSRRIRASNRQSGSYHPVTLPAHCHWYSSIGLAGSYAIPRPRIGTWGTRRYATVAPHERGLSRFGVSHPWRAARMGDPTFVAGPPRLI